MTAKKTTKPTTKKYTAFGWNYEVGRGVHYTETFPIETTVREAELHFHTLFRETAEYNDPKGEGDNIWLVSVVEVTHCNGSNTTNWHGYDDKTFRYFISAIAIELPFLQGEVKATTQRVAKEMVKKLITQKSNEFMKKHPDIHIDIERLLADLVVE